MRKKSHQISFLFLLGITANPSKSIFECYLSKLDENKSFMTYQLQNLTVLTFKSNRKHLEEFSLEGWITSGNKLTHIQMNTSNELICVAFS